MTSRRILPASSRKAPGADDTVTVENMTLVNPYKGIVAGPGNNGHHRVRNLYGTPLVAGLEFERCIAIGRLEGIDFNPYIWSEPGLPGTPAENGEHAAWMQLL